MPKWQFIAAALALAAYALLAHVLMVVAADRPWAIVVLLGPLLLVLLTVALQQRHPPALWASALLACAMGVYLVANDGRQRVEHLYVVQHAGIHAALGFVFAGTLRRGATPLISVFAARVHGALTAALARYTRRLTVVWAAYFALMVLMSVGLYAWAPWWVWSLFANLFTPLAAAALFVGEYLLRYRLHPEFERATLWQALQAYRATPLVPARRP